MILDAITEVFVWIGVHSNDGEKNMAMETAIKYIKMAPEDRTDSPVYVIYAGHEPPLFTCYFLAWDASKAAESLKTDEHGESMDYLRKLAKLQEEAPKLFRMNSRSVLPKFKPEDLKPSPTVPSTTVTSSSPSTSKKQLSSTSLPTTTTPSSPIPTPASASVSSPASPKVSGSASPNAGKLNKLSSKFGKKTPEKEGKPAFEEDEEGKALALLPTYSYAILKVRPLPDDVDHGQMEKHMSHEEFHEVMKMTRKEWEKAPKWKKIKVKKEVCLF
jgi:hypothetical protein